MHGHTDILPPMAPVGPKIGNYYSSFVFSVAPSFFHTCVAAGSKGVARMEDVERFKVSSGLRSISL